MTAADVSNESDRDLDLQRLVGTFAGLVRQYPDLDFLDPGGMLVIKDPVPAVSQVRIELPGSTALRLRSVLLEADGLDDPAAQVTATASSAASKEAAARLRKGGLLLADQTGVGVQTRREDRPWLELALDRPRDLRRITVINVADQTALDARGIRVLVRTADGWWTTLYDGAARERTFAQHVERHFGGRLLTRRLEDAVRRRLNRPAPTRPQPVAADLVRIMTAIQLRDHGPVFKDIDRVPLDKERMSEFRRLVSEQLVARRQQEWTIHGIKRSFRFWTEQEKKDYLGFAVDVVNCLNQLNSCVCFGFGSVFSIVRDHELLPHDDDLDVLIGFDPEQASTLAEGLALIKKCLQDKGFVVTGNFTSYHWVYPPGGGGSKLDAFVGLFEGDTISWYPGKRGALTREMMFPPSHRELLGFDCAVPRQPERYLEQVYGPGWAKPDPHFRHRWKRSEYADIAK